MRPALQSKAGFTLMEALIALAIAATTLGAIMGIQQQLINAQRQNDRILKTSNIERDALALIKDVNPTSTPEGEIELPPSLMVRWTSEAVSDDKLTAGFPRGDGNYTATLYSVSVTVQDGSGQDVIAPFKVERVGWVSANQVATAAPATRP